MARSCGVLPATYALSGMGVLVCNWGRNDFATLVLGLGCLLLAAVQLWLGVRKVGPDKTREQLLLGPFYALLSTSFFYRGCTQDNGHFIGFGLCFLILAALYAVRTVWTLRDRPASD